MKILKFIQFINESKESRLEYGLDTRFPWDEEIETLIDSLTEKAHGIKEGYGYGRHLEDGFEFNIKDRTSADFEVLSKKYKISLNELYNDWEQFLADSLEMAGIHIVENSDFFKDWFQEGSSGGYLCLQCDNDLIQDDIQAIDELLRSNDYHDYREIEDDRVKLWKELGEKGKSGFRLLQRNELIDKDFSDIEEQKKRCEEIIGELEDKSILMDKLEIELEGVKTRIKKFWEDSGKYFEEQIQSNLNVE